MYNEKIAGGGFHHIAMKVYDLDATLKFYKEGLGFKHVNAWKHPDGSPDGTMLESGDGAIFEFFPGGEKEQPTGALIHIALKTDDCDKAMAAAVQAGGVVTMEPTSLVIKGDMEDVPVRIAFFKGINGEVIEFFQIRKV